MTAGDKQTVSVTAAGGKGDTITFTSSKKGVLKVNKASAKASAKGIAKMSVAAVSEGTAKLTVASKNTGVKKAFTIKVVAATPAPATQAPATNVPTSGGGVTGTATTAPTATAGVQATATAGTDATATPGTDVTATPGADVTATPGTDVTATPGADVTATPEVTVAPSFDPVTAKEGTLTVTTNVSGASIKVISGGATVASVEMNPLENSVTTGTLQPGVYTVEITKKGYDKKTETVTIDGDATLNVSLFESVVLGASATVTNSLIEYENTVLVNDNAIVTVTVKDKDGNLVPNKTVVFSANKLAGSGRAAVDVEVKGQNVQSTDANGRASFVIGLKNPTTDSTDTLSVVSAEFSAKVLDVTDGTNSTISGCVGFAALDLASVGVDEGTRKSKNLAVGENAKKVGYDDAYTGSENDRHDGIAETYSLKKKAGDTKDVHYISTQKVSTEGTEERAVTFDVNPKIVLPMMSTQDTEMRDFVQPVNEKSGDYFTYATNEYDKIIVLKEDTSKLQYATLMFNEIKISKYTKLVIESYTDEACTASKKIDAATVEIKGQHVQKDFGYQIPLNSDAVKAIKVSLKSAGQVQTDMNSGYDIREIVGVYNSSSNTTAGATKNITTAKVSWETVNPTMSNFVPLDTSIVTATAGLNITPKDAGNTFDYQVPVFPYTGDAVIREFDSNKKIVAYYLVPTIKGTYELDDTHTDPNLVDMNTNIIAPGEKAYEATETEAINHQVGTIKADGNNVIVNSSEVGSTNLKGSITLPSLGGDVLDASNKNVYTSVQWNPLPKDAEVATSDAFLALAGQNVTVYAQLSDKNGNPVSLADKEITYTLNGTTTTLKSTSTVDEINGTAIVKNTNTDVNGRATLTLNNAQAAVIDDLKATAGDYDVVLYIGKEKASTADIYWVNADLAFQKSVGAAYDRTDNDDITVKTDKPVVSTPWQYAVKTVGNVFVSQNDKDNKVDTDGNKVYAANYYKGSKYPGVLEGYSIDIDGLKINTSFDEDNKGTYKVVGNGIVDASSDREYNDAITNELNDSSVGSDVTFTATKGDTTKTYACVGEGSANMTAKLKLSVSWEAEGSMLSMITPAGTTISKLSAAKGYEGKTGSNTWGYTDLYVKVTDATGKNPKANAVVDFKSGTSTDVFTDGKSTGADHTTTSATTDANGIAHVVLNMTDNTNQKSSVITASVSGMDDVATTTINWVKRENALSLVNAGVSATDEKQVVLTFNNEINASSVNKDMFEIEGSNSTDTDYYQKKFDIVGATASGRYVYLTLQNALPTSNFKVSVNSTKNESIVYNLTDTKGVTIDKTTYAETTDTFEFYSAKSGSFDAAVSYDYTVAGSGVADVATVKIDNIKTGLDDAAVTATAAEAAFANRFVVTVDGEVQTISQKVSNTHTAANAVLRNGATVGNVVVECTKFNGTMKNAEFNLYVAQASADQKIGIYYLGGSATKTLNAANGLGYTNYVVDTTAHTVTFEFSRNVDYNTPDGGAQYTAASVAKLITVDGEKLDDISNAATKVSLTTNTLTIDVGTGYTLAAATKITIPEGILTDNDTRKFKYTNAKVSLNSLDLVAPKIKSAKIGSTTSELVVTFDEAVDASAARTTSNWTLSDGSTNPTSVVVSKDGKTVTLTFAAVLTSGETVEADPANIIDIHGNVIDGAADKITLPTTIAVGANAAKID